MQAQKPELKLWCHDPRALLLSSPTRVLLNHHPSPLIFSFCSLEVAHRKGVNRSQVDSALSRGENGFFVSYSLFQALHSGMMPLGGGGGGFSITRRLTGRLVGVRVEDLFVS